MVLYSRIKCNKRNYVYNVNLKKTSHLEFYEIILYKLAFMRNALFEKPICIQN